MAHNKRIHINRSKGEVLYSTLPSSSQGTREGPNMVSLSCSRSFYLIEETSTVQMLQSSGPHKQHIAVLHAALLVAVVHNFKPNFIVRLEILRALLQSFVNDLKQPQ
jgi:hypothetical protein